MALEANNFWNLWLPAKCQILGLKDGISKQPATRRPFSPQLWMRHLPWTSSSKNGWRITWTNTWMRQSRWGGERVPKGLNTSWEGVLVWFWGDKGTWTVTKKRATQGSRSLGSVVSNCIFPGIKFSGDRADRVELRIPFLLSGGSWR